MCVCPISVKNRKLDFDPLVDRLYNCVPCGQCYECQEAKRNGYEVRSLYEYYYTKQIGGSVYYFTLTYNNSCVPKVPNTELMCASIDDVQRFFKRLRKRSFVKFRYFIVSEYGHKTFRPHYHGFIFFDEPVSSSVANKLIKDSWNLGFVCFGENHGLVRDVRPFAYVSKYVCKDFDFTHFLLDQVEKYPALTSYMESDLSFRKKFTINPIHLSSQKFGLSICNCLKDTDLVKGYFVANDSVGLNRKLAIPLYIVRYMLYDKYKNSNDTISYRLNKRGQYIFRRKMLYQYNKLCDLYIRAFQASLSPDVYKHCPAIISKFTFDEYCNLVYDILYNTGVSWLVSYKLLYHDITTIPFAFESFHEDLEIFCSAVFDKHFTAFTSRERFEVPFPDDCEIVIKFAEEIIAYFRYQTYLKNVSDYNRKQLHLSLQTKEKKLKPVISLSVFKNNVKFYRKPYESCLNPISVLSEIA